MEEQKIEEVIEETRTEDTLTPEQQALEKAKAEARERKKNRIKKSSKFFSEFKKFITRGNIIDLSVGVIIGGAFTAIVTALTTNIFQPLINFILSLGGSNALESARTVLKKSVDASGQIDWSNSIYIDWGTFISAIINFLLIAFILFIVVKIINNIAEKKKQFDAKLLEDYYKKYPEERPVPEEKKPTELEVLLEIRDSLKEKDNSKKEDKK